MKRVYGRIPLDPLVPKGPKQWIVITTDSNGFSDAVHLTALAQTLLLNLNESPFWGNFGIAAKQAVLQQIPPDIFVTAIQRYYQQFFAAITVAKTNDLTPTYDINVITQLGSKLSFSVPVPI